MEEMFRKLAQNSSKAAGSFQAFVLALLIIIVWSFTGPLLNYSTTWQLTINSFTTVVTFLMVFLIQNTQNRDAKAVHLKLDELLRAMKGARAKLIDTDELSDKELEDFHQEFIAMSQKYERALARRSKNKNFKEKPAEIIE